MVELSILIPDHLYDWLRAYCEQWSLTESEVIEAALIQIMEEE